MGDEVGSQLDLPHGARALLDAVVAIGSDLDMHSVLDRLVRSACELTGARYGALGVIGGGSGLSDFITHGIDPALRAEIGEEPHGRGILGLLIENPQPLRLRRLQDHDRSYGFPPGHPPMTTFLGVPVRIRGTVFGNLYLTEKADGAEFTEQDEVLIQALASAAGFVIENARAYGLSERRRQWLEASAQINEALQPPISLELALHQIAISARSASNAAAVAVVQRDADDFVIAASDGAAAAEVPTVIAESTGELERCIHGTEVIETRDAAGHVVVLVPLRAHLGAHGVLLVVRDHHSRLSHREDGELLASFADQASLALDRAQAVADREELAIVSERDRIARDLHDLVIQRLFATGLQLQGARQRAVIQEVADRIDAAVTELDVTIRDIRATIFELHTHEQLSLRAEAMALVKEYVPVLGFTPAVRTIGPVDTAVSPELVDQVLAVLREAMSNVARHSLASSAVIDMNVGDGTLLLRIVDDGTGLPESRKESGLRNVRRRAAELGGAVRLFPTEPHGTTLEWRVPLSR